MYAHTCRAARECIVYNRRMLGDAYVGRTGRARYMVCVEKAGAEGGCRRAASAAAGKPQFERSLDAPITLTLTL